MRMTGGGATNDSAAGERKRAAPGELEAGELEARSRATAAGAQASGQQQQQHFKVSPLRWTMLVGVCAFGFFNGVANEGSSILNVYVEVLGLSLSDYVYLSQAFFLVPFVASFLAAGLTDRFGAKLAIFTALLLATVRNCARALLFAPHVPGWHQLRLIHWAFQRLFTQLTVAIYYCLPLKLAESWFAEEERSLALTLMLVVPILGSAAAALTYPRFVRNLATIQPLAWVNVGAACASLLVVSLCFRRSRPHEGAPSARNQANLAKLNEAPDERLLAKLARILRNRHYVIQVISLSVFDPLMWNIQSILQDIFLNAGLTSVFCGQFLALSSVLGAAMQITCSLLWKAKRKRQRRAADTEAAARQATSGEKIEAAAEEQPQQTARDPFRTRKCKALLAARCAAFLLFCHTLILHELYPNARWLLANQWWLLLVASIAHLLVRFWAAPYYNEQSAELICGAISEPTSSACQMIVSSVWSNLVAIVFVRLRQVKRAEQELGDEEFGAGYEAAGQQPERAIYKHSVLFEALLAVCATAFYLAKFAPNKQRARAAQLEREAANARAAASSSPSGANATDEVEHETGHSTKL